MTAEVLFPEGILYSNVNSFSKSFLKLVCCLVIDAQFHAQLMEKLIEFYKSFGSYIKGQFNELPNIGFALIEYRTIFGQTINICVQN